MDDQETLGVEMGHLIAEPILITVEGIKDGELVLVTREIKPPHNDALVQFKAKEAVEEFWKKWNEGA